MGNAVPDAPKLCVTKKRKKPQLFVKRPEHPFHIKNPGQWGECSGRVAKGTLEDAGLAEGPGDRRPRPG